MKAEKRAFTKHIKQAGESAPINCISTGIGPKRSLAFVAQTDMASMAPLLVVGYGGSAAADLKPGDVFVATQISASDSKEPIALPFGKKVLQYLSRVEGLPSVSSGAVFCSPKLVFGNARREEVYNQGSEVIEMESWWLLKESARLNQTAVVRVISDSRGSHLGILALPKNIRRANKSLNRLGKAFSVWDLNQQPNAKI